MAWQSLPVVVLVAAAVREDSVTVSVTVAVGVTQLVAEEVELLLELEDEDVVVGGGVLVVEETLVVETPVVEDTVVEDTVEDDEELPDEEEDVLLVDELPVLDTEAGGGIVVPLLVDVVVGGWVVEVEDELLVDVVVGG